MWRAKSSHEQTLMKWANVRLILGREIRDQLRDRRTLFMIAVLPLLLYPLLAITLMQVAQFLRESPSRVLLVGLAELPSSPPLVEDGQIAPTLFSAPAKVGLVDLTVAPVSESGHADELARGRQLLDKGQFDAVVYFPPQFGENLQRFRMSVGSGRARSGQDRPVGPVDVPRPSVFFNTAKDKSRVARDRVCAVLGRWREQIVDETLREYQLSSSVTAPFEVLDNDVAEPSGRRAAIWSKVLPFIMIVWALTGAFYPAVDLCAGEKERGTLETLLTSPAERGEIVMGKLLTIMLFSMATSLLNLISMAVTASFVIEQLHSIGPATDPLAMGPPTPLAMGWLALALLPISALFSALSLALATMARSTKEGQYYLMPLLLITMPLLVLAMLPASELNLGTSLIPVAGVMLLLRSLMESEYSTVFLYAVPVILVTLGCCLLAIRWAIDQFSNEAVLFRESERLDLGLWLVHLVRDRGPTPSTAEAIMFGVLLLLIRFFAGFLLPMPDTWERFATMALLTQIALVALPGLAMTILLTRSPRETLLLVRPAAPSVLAAVLLAICLHPIALALSEFIRYLYPIPESIVAVNRLLEQAPSNWHLILTLALVPALCEEITFRGFILSGLRHMGDKWKAIGISALFFGFAHGVLQQSLMATAVGTVIGYLAVQTRSLVPCIAFHLVHNAMALLSAQFLETIVAEHPTLHWLLLRVGDGYMYNWPMVVASAMLTAVLLGWFRALPYQRTPEKRLTEAPEHQSAHVPAR
jgi:sodium transport system permease protein